MVAGIVGGIMGTGGGVLLVPLLTRLSQADQHKAHGTSLAIVFFIALSGAAFYVLRGDVNWALVAEIAVGGICGVLFGTKLMMRISQRKLSQGFGFFALFLAAWMFLKPFLSLPLGSVQGVTVTTAIALCIGLIAGILAGMLGVGGSLVTIPSMVLLLGVNQHTAQGVALSVIVPTALVGAIAHRRQGNVKADLAFQIVPSAIGFSLLGAWISGLLAGPFLTVAFGALLLIIGFRMVLSTEG